jgi:agmatine/peptidylarginine deiminase
MRVTLIIFLSLLIYLPILLVSTEPVIHKLPDLNHLAFPNKTTRDAPDGDEIINPPEFSRTDGVFLAWAGWDEQLIADIALPISQQYQVYMLVRNTAYQAQAYAYLLSQNVNMENVHFIIDSNITSSSMWIRDYAPFFIQEDGINAIDDFYYGGFSENDLISYTIAETFDLPIYDSPMIHHGGNHISDGNGMGFFSNNIYDLNPAYTKEEVDAEFRNFFGLDSLIVIEPMAGDGTGHIDMFCKLLDDTTFIIGEYDDETECYPGDRELLNELAEEFSTLTNLDGRAFQVVRIPMPPYTYGGPANTINYTYTNSLIINDLVLVPVYGFDSDAIALEIYQNLMPNHTIIGIDSSFIIQYWGAVHCVTNEYFSENPLIILHEKLTQISSGDEPLIHFRLNPKFLDSSASVYVKPVSETDFWEVPATWNAGVWTARIPAMTEHFHYYISGNATSSETSYQTTLPKNAPDESYFVECTGTMTENDAIQAIVNFTNYPNPFNPSTTISFFLPNDAKVNIAVFNIKGQKIITLVDEFTKKGNHSTVWNGEDEKGNVMNSGVFLYQAAIDGKAAAVKKCLLMK